MEVAVKSISSVHFGDCNQYQCFVQLLLNCIHFVTQYFFPLSVNMKRKLMLISVNSNLFYLELALDVNPGSL